MNGPSPGRRGRLIALEGIDGCGKSTQARRLADHLGARLAFEPGETALGRELRRLLLDGEGPPPTPRAEALLVAADRAQHVAEVVEPELAAGRWVVTDRFSGSTLAYQGAGRGLAVAGLRAVVDWAADGLWPDLSVLVDLPVAAARERLAAVRPDRLEGLGEEFAERVRRGFLDLAAADPDHWVVIDGRPSPDQVAEALVAAVAERLGPAPGAVPGEAR